MKRRGDAVPDPARVRDVAEFVETLQRLRTAVGGPSYRTLATRVGPLLRPPRELPHSTLSDLFRADRRRLDLDLVLATVRALGVDENGVAEWRAACVRVQKAAGQGFGGQFGGPVAGVLKLPPDLATFIGRRAELEALLGAVAGSGDGSGGDGVGGDQGSPDGGGPAHPSRSARPPTVVISAIEGMGGVGKTRLAVHLAHTLAAGGRFADAQLYVNLRGFDPDHAPVDPDDVLESLLRQLGVSAHDIPAGSAERAALFRDRMHGRDAVLILDNAADVQQVRPLIPASPTCLVLVTSRRSLADLEEAVWHQLGVFSEDEALALLVRIAGEERVAAEAEAARRIVRRCGLLPLAVSVAATRLRSRTSWRLTDLADRLEREDATTSDIGGAAFDVSYRDLPDSAKHVFRLLGVHPGIDFTAASVAVPAGVRVEEAERALELLLDEHLLQQRVAGRYEIHDLLRAYAAERARAELTEEEREAVVRSAIGWDVAAVTLTALEISPDRVMPPVDPAMAAVCGPQAHTPADAVVWYGRERSNLMQAVTVAGRMGLDGLAWRLPIAMAYFEELGQNYRELERLMTGAMPHARADDDPDAETDVVRWLAFTLSAQHRAGEAIEPLHRVLEARRAAGDGLRAGRVLGALAQATHSIGDAELGLGYALEATRTIEAAGGPVPSAVLTITSICLVKLERFAEALEYQTAFVERSRKADDRRAVALGLHNVADNLLRQGRTAEAGEAFRESVAVATEVGDLYVQADCLNGLALCLKAAGRVDDARARHREALALFDGMAEEDAARYLAQLERSSLNYVE